MLIGYDVETTGLDLWHGCGPFAFAAVSDNGDVHSRLWNVDPLTRQVLMELKDIELVGDLLDQNEMVAHNVGFDMRATEIMFGHPQYEWEHDWNWDGIEDTLIAAHALRNLWPHNLKLLRSVFCGVGNRTVDLLQRAVNHARRICRGKAFMEKHGRWRLADAEDPHWPAIKRAPKNKGDETGWWLFDMWLPHMIVQLAPEFLPPESQYDDILRDPSYEGFLLHPWENMVLHYCIEDAMSTLALWHGLRAALGEEGLLGQYLERKEVLRCCYRMESNGVHILPRILDEIKRYQTVSGKHRAKAEIFLKQAGNEKPNINSTMQLKSFLYGDMGLPVLKKTEKGNPSTDADTLEKLADHVPDHHWGKGFVEEILACRKNEKAADYLTSYKKWSVRNGRIANLYWTLQARKGSDTARHHQAASGSVPRSLPEKDHDYLLRRNGGYLHPSVNVTGTKFTRQSSSNPNVQNVGTGSDEGNVIDFRLRYSFGPPPGMVWLDYDYANIELRIWAYLCGNKEFIMAFEQGKSIHLLIAQELHPELRDYKSTDDIPDNLYPKYKKTKNGNFAIIYGATPFTADKTYGVSGAYNKIAERFPEVRTFTQQLHFEVNSRGFVETLTGYRLYVPVEDPHKAVSAKVQGTAGSVIGRAMVNCTGFLDEHYPVGKLILQVHDELVFEVPRDYPPFVLQGIEEAMTRVQDDIGIPLGVSGEVIRDNWAEGEPL